MTIASGPGSFAGWSTTSVNVTNGVATFSNLILDTAGSYTLTATPSGITGVTAAVTSTSFAVSPAAENKLVVTTEPASSITSGGTISMGVTVEDTYGNTITTGNTGSTDTISVAPTAGSPQSSFSAGTTSVAASNGVASFSGLQLNTAGSYTITASDTTHSSVATAVSTGVTVNPGTQSGFTLSAATTTPAAGAGDNLTITAVDSHGNTITSYTGSHNLTFSGGTTIGSYTPSVTDTSGNVDAFGTATPITFTNGVATVSGSSNGVMTLYKAAAQSIGVTDGTYTATALVVTPTPGSAVSFSVTNPGAETAGTAYSQTITALDTYGNTATSYTGSKSLVFSGASNSPNNTAPTVGGTAFGSATSVTFTNGVATPSVTLTNAQPTAITATQGSITGTSTSITVNPGTAASLNLAATTSTPTAGSGDNLTITALDSDGNTATSYTGSHSLTFAGASASPSGSNPTVTNSSGTATNFGTATALTFTNGVATVSGTSNGVMTIYKAGSASITASATSPTLASNTLSVTVSAGASATALSISGATTTPVAGAGDNLTITAVDQYGNTAPSYTGSHNLTFGGASASPNSTNPTVSNSSGTATTFGTPTAITFSSGIATISGTSNGVMVLYKSGATTVTVTDGSITNGSGTVFTVSPASAVSFTPVETGTQTAGTSFTITITAYDTYGNVATGYTGSQSLIFSGPSNSPSPSTVPTAKNSSGTAVNFGTATPTTFTSGGATVTVTLYDAQTTSITVTQSSVTGTSNSFTVNPTTLNSFTWSSLSTTTPTAGTPLTATISALDAYGNAASGYISATDCVTFSGPSSSPNSTAPSYPAQAACASGQSSLSFNASGQATGVSFTLYDAQSIAITTTSVSPTGKTGISPTLTVGSASAASFAITNPGAQTAGTAFTLAITAKDAYGNVATGETSTQSLVFSGPSNSPNSTVPTANGTAFGSPTSVTFASGASSGLSIKLYDVQTTSITATQGSVTGNSGTFSVGANSAATFTVSNPGAPTAGTSFSVSVTAYDAYGNQATTYTGSQSLVFSGPSNSPNATVPTAKNSSNTAINFGSATATTFASGAATVTVTLYDAQTTQLTVTQSSVTGTSTAFTVSSTTAATLVLAANTTTPAAGTGDNLTITANDTYGNTATGYTGSKNLTFGGAHAQGSNNPTVSNSSGTAIPFGTVTAITFTNGVSTVSGSNNGVMTLYKTETVSITVTDGSISNGTGLSVTVGSGTANQLVFVQGPSAAFTGIAMSPAVTVQVEDAYGNTVADNGLQLTITPSTGSISSGATASTNSSGLATFSSLIWSQTYLGITITAGPTSSGTGISATPAFFVLQRDRSRQHWSACHGLSDRRRIRCRLGELLLLLRILNCLQLLERNTHRDLDRLVSVLGCMEQPAG